MNKGWWFPWMIGHLFLAFWWFCYELKSRVKFYETSLHFYDFVLSHCCKMTIISPAVCWSCRWLNIWFVLTNRSDFNLIKLVSLAFKSFLLRPFACLIGSMLLSKPFYHSIFVALLAAGSNASNNIYHVDQLFL